MSEHERLAVQFEAHRTHLRSVAFRMLGSINDADDVVQEAWLRLSRTGWHEIENLGGWLTTVVARICLDTLRSRRSRRETPFESEPSLPAGDEGTDPEHEALMADSVGIALHVVLETLSPAERIAFVLHDMFGVPHEQIAPIVERSPVAARQLASRARRRVRGRASVPHADLNEQRCLVEAFLTAAREGDFAALLAVLDPDVVARADRGAVSMGVSRELQGADAVAAMMKGRARAGRLALVNGSVGVLWAPTGQPRGAISFTMSGGRIVGINLFGDPEHLRRLELAPLD